MEYTIELKNVYKGYTDTSGKRVEVIQDMNLAFEKGKMYGIMGVSGSGKTTLLSIMGILERFDKGELVLEGEMVQKLKENEMADIRREKIGFVFQNYYLNPKLNVADNIILALRINKKISKSSYQERVHSLLEEFHMTEHQKRYPMELSGGEQQRVCIARALANNPDIILADEPTGSLDSENEKVVMECLKKLAEKGKTVIVVSHNDVIKDFADHMIYLEKGGRYVSD